MNWDTLAEMNRLDIIRLCHSGLDSQTLRGELLKRLQPLIPFNYAYFSTTDPATQLVTHSVLAEPPPTWLMPIFLENEFLQDDFNKFSEMLRTRQPVAVLSHATQNDLDRSQRYREMLIPLAMEDELRAVFVSDGVCWGTLCLHREHAESNYTPADAAYLAQLAPHIAEGLRKGLLLGDAPLAKTPDGPGVLMLTDDLTIIGMTAAAEYWLREMTETEQGDQHTLPLIVRGVAAGLQRVERGLASPDFTPKARLRTRSGHWLVLYASRLRHSDNHAQITVIIELAQPVEIAPLVMHAYQLTKREAEVVRCVLRGWSTAEIATMLHISSNTVQDHLKAIFEKADVGSRGELAARIFVQQYQ